MTPDLKWTKIEIDHVKLLCLFDVSKDDELGESFNWSNTQLLSKEVHHCKLNLITLINVYSNLNIVNLSEEMKKELTKIFIDEN